MTELLKDYTKSGIDDSLVSIDSPLNSEDINNVGVITNIASESTGTGTRFMNSTHDIVFSATDADTVEWTAGHIYFQDGTSYSIEAGNTGNMVAETFIYFDLDISRVALQVTTTKVTAEGGRKLLISIAEDSTTKANFTVFNSKEQTISDSNIESLTVSKLTAGTISSQSIVLSAPTADVEIRANIAAGDFSNAGVASGFILGKDFSDSGKAKFYFGDTINFIKWDASTLSFTGTVTATSLSTTSDTITINSDFTDANIDLIFGRTTGGNATMRYDGTTVNIDKSFTVSGTAVVLDSRTLTAGDGLTGGGDLSSNRTFAVGAGNGITVNADDVALTTPGTLTVSTTNVATGNHTHAITSSSNPGATASLLATDASGFTTVVKLCTDTLTDKSGANLIISPTGDVVFDPTGNDILPTTGYDLNIGSLDKKYLTLHAAELWVETLVAQNTIATIGGRILVGPTTTLTSDLTSIATTIYVKHNEMANGDRVYMEANGAVEFMSIDSAPGGVGPYSYTVTRDLDGSGANAWNAGDAIFNTGTTGDGFIDIYSVAGIKAGTEYGPAITGNVRNSATYNDWTSHWCIGNLNGLYGYGATTYGVAMGEYAANKSHLTIDSTNGIRLFTGVSGVIGQWSPTGLITVGEVGASKSNILISDNAILLRTNTDNKIVLGTDGNISLTGNLAVGATGAIYSGQTAYNNGTGYWFEYNAGTPRFSIGNSTDTSKLLLWDGTDLIVNDSRIANQNIFGDGSDGNLTTSGDVTLSSDMYYDNLTIDIGDTLYSAGYRIFVKGIFTNNGTIARNGVIGSNGTDGTLVTPGVGGAGGTALATGSIYGSVAGSAGGNGELAAGNNGDAGTALANSFGSNGVAGGDALDGTYTGGDGGIAGVATQTLQPIRNATFAIIMRDFSVEDTAKLIKSAGGSGGGGGGTGGPNGGGGTGGGGGGAGSGGGIILISAKKFINNGIIEVIGGDGGNGGNGTTGGGVTNGTTGGGGGGAGSGGIIIILYSYYTNDGSLDLSGGTGGTGGTGFAWDGSPSEDGSNGLDGITMTLNV